MKRLTLGATAIITAAVALGSGVAPTHAASSHAYGGPPQRFKVCLHNPTPKKCHTFANSGSGAAAAVQFATALANAANACVPKSSAACQALLAEANQAAALARRLASANGVNAGTIPSTGGGGTYGNAGTAAAVSSVGGYTYGASSTSSNVAGRTSQSVTALPATGGAAGLPGSNGNPIFPILATLAIIVAGFGFRKGFARSA